MQVFLSGAIAMGCFAAGLFFLRYWSRTRDPLFRTFAVAFWMLAVERLLQLAVAFNDDPRALGLVIRLLAFTLIIIAIVRKNRAVAKT